MMLFAVSERQISSAPTTIGSKMPYWMVGTCGRIDVVDAKRTERDAHGEPAKENDSRGAKRPRAIEGGHFCLHKRSMQAVEDGNDCGCGPGEHEIGR